MLTSTLSSTLLHVGLCVCVCVCVHQYREQLLLLLLLDPPATQKRREENSSRELVATSLCCTRCYCCCTCSRVRICSLNKKSSSRRSSSSRRRRKCSTRTHFYSVALGEKESILSLWYFTVLSWCTPTRATARTSGFPSFTGFACLTLICSKIFPLFFCLSPSPRPAPGVCELIVFFIYLSSSVHSISHNELLTRIRGYFFYHSTFCVLFLSHSSFSSSQEKR